MTSPRSPDSAVVEAFVEGLIAGETISTAAEKGGQPAFQQSGLSPRSSFLFISRGGGDG